MQIHVANAEGFSFRCLPGCGFCCATSPSVLAPDEKRAAAAGLPVIRRPDGTFGLRMVGSHCEVLGADRACSKYEARPFACRSFPVQLHALDRLQADLHLGCPGLVPSGDARSFAGSLGSEVTAALRLAKDIAEEAIRQGVLDIEGARTNSTAMRERLDKLGYETDADAVLAPFREIQPTDPDTLAGLYAAAGQLDLVSHDVIDAIDALGPPSRSALPSLLTQVAREVPKRDPDHVAAGDASYGWKPIDIARAKPKEALTLDAEARRPLDAHLQRLLHRDLTWGHALWLIDQADYAPSPAAAVARALADAASGLLLRRALLQTSDEAIASFEWWYWGSPTIGAAL
ncbi:MAG: YkgJ family cysteine cluster protein [Thermoplasmatota archaeon]